MKKKTTEQFIKEAQNIHNNKYTYEKTVYTGAFNKVIITCPKHGDFLQIPHDHLQGKGCKSCMCDKAKLRNLSNTQEFIEKAKRIHGDKYDYSKVDYKDAKTKVCIICPKHGEFYQTPDRHLRGQGCPKCSGKNKTTEEWIEQAKHIHKNRYNYSNSIYINSITPIKIICPIHGEFQQLPANHLNGHGCYKCSRSHGEIKIENYLNNLNIEYKSFYRISIDKNINPKGYAEIDFYIPSMNLFIEYNGRQHYIPIEYFGGSLELEHQQKRDEFVREYCKRNNIRLLEIPYTDESNIDNILNDLFYERSKI